MLAVHMGVDIPGADAEGFGQLRLEPRRIQNRAGTDDAVGRDAGDFMEHIRHDVHGIGDNDVNCVRGVFDHIGGNIPQDIHIGLRQLQPGLTGFAGKTGGDDHHLGTSGIGIIAGPDNGRRAEGGSLVNVHRLAKGFLLIDINEHDFRGNIGRHHVVCNGCANAARADDRDFVSHSFLLLLI